MFWLLDYSSGTESTPDFRSIVQRVCWQSGRRDEVSSCADVGCFTFWALSLRSASGCEAAVCRVRQIRVDEKSRLMLMLLSWIQIIGYFKWTCRCIVANGCNWTTWQLVFSHQLWCENFRPRCFQKGQRLRTRSPVEVEMYLTCSTKVTPQVNQAAGWPGSYEDMATASGLSPKKWLSSVCWHQKQSKFPNSWAQGVRPRIPSLFQTRKSPKLWPHAISNPYPRLVGDSDWYPLVI